MSESIHSDGSVELFQRWLPGGAQGNTDQVFFDGDEYIMAIAVETQRRGRVVAGWKFEVVTAAADADGITFDDSEGDLWGYEWRQVQWFLPCSELDLPFLDAIDVSPSPEKGE